MKQGQKIICKLEGYGSKSWEELSEKTGELEMKTVRTLHFVSDKGIPFQMFENGGLKSVSDAITVGNWIELEHEGMEDITLENGDPGRVNKYGVYSAEAPKHLASA